MKHFRGIPHHIQATVVLILINMIVFVVTASKGNSVGVLIEHGAMYPPLININAEFWRLLTAMFLHGSVFHLVLNMWSLFIVGSILEPIFSRDKFLVLYLGSGLLGSAFSYTFSSYNTVSFGASSAIFGLFAAIVLLATLFPYHAGIRNNAQSFVSTILINLGIGFFVPGLDMLAHVGGLIGGAIMLYCLGIGYYKPIWKYLCAGIYIVLLVGLLLLGYQQY